MNVFIKYKCLEYDRVVASKGIDLKKTTDSHERIISHYWYFLQIGFRYQQKVCDGCHDLIQEGMSY